MPPFIRDDKPLAWDKEDQDQNQDQDQDQDQNQNQNHDQDHHQNEEPIIEDDELTDSELYMALLQVRTTVEQNRANAERAGLNMPSFHQRLTAYSDLLIEFTSAVNRKLALNRQGHTAETAMDHSAVSQEIHRLFREISEYFERYMRE
ncbi:GL14728 [Drosophila persimilis]|uniref:GL14728 n=1 Tax=Drosophila persimilis TaxID=7234 RepID=B4GVV6_DROPE|nr:GL14728 [Drosophila persimilis]